jgi:hypothetical protein
MCRGEEHYTTITARRNLVNFNRDPKFFPLCYLGGNQLFLTTFVGDSVTMNIVCRFRCFPPAPFPCA